MYSFPLTPNQYGHWGKIFITYFSVPTYLPILLDRATFLSAQAGMLLWVSHTIVNTAHWSRRVNQVKGARVTSCFLLWREAWVLWNIPPLSAELAAPDGKDTERRRNTLQDLWKFLMPKLKISPVTSKENPLGSKVISSTGNKKIHRFDKRLAKNSH